MSSVPGGPTEPTPQSQRMPTPAEMAAAQGVPARGASHYAKGTAANMVRSMAVIIAIAFALYFISGRTNGQAPDTVDVVGSAQHHAQQSGHPYAYPEDLPEEWSATDVRYANSDGVMTWQAGYTTADDEYVALKQAVDPDEEWLAVQTQGGQAQGQLVTQDGREWAKLATSGAGQRSIVFEPQQADGITTVVTGTVGWDQLEEFADHLVAAETRAGASPAS